MTMENGALELETLGSRTWISGTQDSGTRESVTQDLVTRSLRIELLTHTVPVSQILRLATDPAAECINFNCEGNFEKKTRVYESKT